MAGKRYIHPDPLVAGYAPEDLMKAPITPPGITNYDERTAKALQNPVRRRYAWGNVLVLAGLGICAIGMGGMVLLPAFGFTVTLSLVEVGASMAVFGIIIHAMQFLPRGSR